jgi:hypothetical protein
MHPSRIDQPIGAMASDIAADRAPARGPSMPIDQGERTASNAVEEPAAPCAAVGALDAQVLIDRKHQLGRAQNGMWWWMREGHAP